MTYYTYILFSEAIQKYYVGYTSLDINERVRRHNSNHKGFTGRTNDWKIVWFTTFDNVSDAIRKEKAIKNRGAKRFLDRLNQ